MSSISPDKRAILDELNRRRSSLSPDKIAILDELNARLNGGPSETLLQSRQAASASEFEQNQPAYTKPENASALTTALDFAIGVERGLGLDPMRPLRSAPSALYNMGKGLIDLGVGGPMRQLEILKGIGRTTAGTIGRGGEALRQQNLPEAAQATGEAYAIAKPIAEAGAAAARPAVAATKRAGGAMSDRLMHSLVRPDKKAFDFGADPIAEAKRIGVSTSEGAMQKVNQANMQKSEAALESAAADRAAAAREIGADDGINIEPFVKAPIQREIQIARDNNNTALASSLEGFMDAQLSRIRREYGGTYLKPTEILREKRTLSQATRFTEDAVGHNMNVARMEMYKGMAGALDRLLPQAKDINHRYASQIELDKLLGKRVLQGKNAPILGSTVFETAKSAIPETAVKTGLSRLLAKQKSFRAEVGGQTYEFYPRPKPGPYESGYQPAGSAAPRNRSEAAEGGVYRPGTTAESAGFPRNRTEAAEGGVYRPGTTAESSGFPRSRSEEIEGGVQRPGTPAESAGFPRKRTDYKPRRPKLTP